MIEGIEKAVLRGPLTVFPKPPWFATNRRAHLVSERMINFERQPSVLKLPGIVWNALFG
jgi:aldehyde dehydrogenase (NAD(P)+)